MSYALSVINLLFLLQKITEEKYDISISGFGDSLVVQRQTEPCVTCTISLTSPTVKDDLPEAGKSLIFNLIVINSTLKSYTAVRSI